MWPRFSLDDIRTIGHYLGSLVLFSVFALCIPFLTGLVFMEWEAASRYLLTIGIALISGTLLRFLRINPGRLDRRQALAVVGLAWIVLALASAVPLYLSGHFASYLDAVFDCVSGYTTTGVTILQDLNHLSYADNMWRFTMHFVGGLGIVVFALSLGLFGKQAGASLYSSEGRSEHVVPNVVQTTRAITKISLIVILVATILLTLLCFGLGIEPVRAVLHALWLVVSAFTTGGFAPMGESAFYYHSISIEGILIVVMILGAISFVVHSLVWKGYTFAFFRDIEIRTLAIWLLMMTFMLTAALSVTTAFSDLSAILRHGIFLLVSAFSTTGFQTITTNQLTTVFNSGAFLVLAMVMAIGGSAGSTAGGIKLQRVGIIAKSIVTTIKETLSPDSARVVVGYDHGGRQLLSPAETKEAMTVFALFVITYVAGFLAGIAHGYDATRALFESITMASNSGMTSGITTPGMPVSLELIYIFQMWAGRLEFVTLLSLIVGVVVSLKPRGLRIKRSERIQQQKTRRQKTQQRKARQQRMQRQKKKASR